MSDNGCGMTRDELETNLGTIARSGTLDFRESNELGEDIDIIGQFGVGFYAAFMISKKVTVISRAYGEDTAYKWESSGIEGYTIEPCTKDSFGTDVILTLKDNTDDEKYDEFLESYKITSLVKKYSTISVTRSKWRSPNTGRKRQRKGIEESTRSDPQQHGPDLEALEVGA